MEKARRREGRGILGQAWCEEAESDVTVQGGGAVGRREDWLLRKASICLPRPAGQEQHGLTSQRQYLKLGDLLARNTYLFGKPRIELN